ncbi:MAG: DUF2817 domain-containing protein, partial [Phycisphaerales bacterium]|nr:DUF2817 domain-containing protein [Phycisphaerales bacterium]
AAGTPRVERLIGVWRAEPARRRGRTVVLVPRANPDGMHEGMRGNRRGVDLNRNFPARNRRERATSGAAALSEPEARVLHDVLVRFRPARIVSLHEPLACLDYDGPGMSLAVAMSSVCPLPVRRLGGRPGSLGSFAGEDLGIPIITMELPGSAARWSSARLWSTYGEALLVAVAGVPTS